MWIVNLEDGKTITEKDTHWDNLNVEKIKVLHIKHHKTGEVAFIREPKGGNYQFFQFKKRALVINTLTGETRKTPVLWQRIGAVVNEQGDCIYIQAPFDRQGFDVRYDNVLSMRLNLSLLRISIPKEVISKRLKRAEGKMRVYLQGLLRMTPDDG